jgi:hypothetical protein
MYKPSNSSSRRKPGPTHPPTDRSEEIRNGRRIGVGKVALPALRTVRAVFPHTALQSVVSSSGISRYESNCMRRAVRVARRRPWPKLICAMVFFDAVTSADTMRSVRTEAFAHDLDGRFRLSALRSSPFGHCQCSLCFNPFITHPPSYPPSLGTALLSVPLAAHHRCSTMRALTPARRSHARQVSSLTPLCLPDIPPPITSCTRTSLCQSPQRVRLFPGFTRPSRLAPTRRRNGFVILRAIRSPPVALHPASRRRSYLRLHAM